MKKIMSMLLALVMVFVATIVPINSSYLGTYTAYADEEGYTRVEWIQELVKTFEMTVEEDNYVDNYYSDISSEDEYYKDIMVATEFGVIELEAGENFEPNSPATREFAVHTMVYCLGLEVEEAEGTEYAFADSADTLYPAEAATAINRGWMQLVDGNFSPSMSLTKTEGGLMLADATSLLADDSIDTSYENTYSFKDGVVIVPDTIVAVKDENGDVLLYAYQDEIPAGTEFVATIGEFPEGFKAVSSERNEESNYLKVSVESVDIGELLTGLDIQGELQAALLDTEAADGTTLTYIEGGTKEESYEDGIHYNSLKDARKSKTLAQ